MRKKYKKLKVAKCMANWNESVKNNIESLEGDFN